MPSPRGVESNIHWGGMWNSDGVKEFNIFFSKESVQSEFWFIQSILIHAAVAFCKLCIKCHTWILFWCDGVGFMAYC